MEPTRAGMALETRPQLKRDLKWGPNRAGGSLQPLQDAERRKGGDGGACRGEGQVERASSGAAVCLLAVGWVVLGWAPGWKVLREKVLLLLLQQLRRRRKWEAGGRVGTGP